jgi:hypothetical protein
MSINNELSDTQRMLLHALCFRIFNLFVVMELLVMTYVDQVNQSCFAGRG